MLYRYAIFGVLFSFCLMMSLRMYSQDFILQGCYWDCPDDASAEIDPASFNFWVEKVKGQAPALSHAGFSYVWLPAFYTGQEEQVKQLVEALQQSGMNAVTDVAFYKSAGGGDSLRFPLQQIHRMRQYLKVEGLRLIADREIETQALAELLKKLQAEKKLPSLLSVRTQEKTSPQRLAAFINALEKQLPESISNELDTRVFDYPLREALRRATSKADYDVRQIFEAGIRDVTALSGFKIITFVNSPEFYNPNGKAGDADDLIKSPLLAYAYLLLNNQLGLPAVFYGDYFGPDSEIEYFMDQPALKEDIDQLIKTHRQFIYRSTSVEYLNQKGSQREAVYLSEAEGAGPDRALILQFDGNNTPAGRAAQGGKDVLAVINFADTTLQVVQEINMSNVAAGDHFTDILGRSETPIAYVGSDSAHQVPNSVFLEVPPRSYSVWVQGRAEKVITSSIDFSAERLEDYVELSWEVPEENRIEGYQLERSINGDQFQSIGWIAAMGSAQQSAAYLFIDENIFPNENLYYRVKVVSTDGHFEYSPVEEVLIPGEQWEFKILSEQESIRNIQIMSNFTAEMELSIFNAEGERIFSSRQNLKPGINQTRVDLSAYPRGVYFIKFTTKKNKQWTQRIVNL